MTEALLRGEPAVAHAAERKSLLSADGHSGEAGRAGFLPLLGDLGGEASQPGHKAAEPDPPRPLSPNF